jgi:RNA polymerase sigma-70 factor (ECF subfamily)
MNSAIDLIYEQLLVLRCQTGDRSAFGEIAQRYSPRLRHYLGSILCSDDSVDDLLQDLWLDVLRAIDSLREPQSLRPWLYRLARDRTFRFLRKRKRLLPFNECECSPATDEVDTLLQVEQTEYIQLVMTHLAPEHREVLLLRFWEGMSYEEMATVTRNPTGTMRSRLHYAKLSVRRLLEKAGVT